MLSSGAVMGFATAMALAGCSSDTATDTASSGAAAATSAASSASSAASDAATDADGDEEAPAGAGATVPAGTTIIALADLPENTATVVKVGDVGVLVARNAGQEVLAFNAICTHEFLADVTVDGQTATCPAHQSEFNAFTGAVEAGPATAPLATISVTVDGDNVVAA
ncbi:Rieske (2Fe-2S) protein [Micrococcales bacterium 31B]|nr:Rieske (2Fe-2S) protein [Micrococcales bacterium 31B]